MPPDPLSAAIEAALAQFSGVIRRVARRHRLSGRDVDDVLQEVRIRLWRAHGGDRATAEGIGAAPAAYVYRTALTAALDLFRRRRSRREDLGRVDPDDPALRDDRGPEREVAALELAEHVARAVDAIAPSRRPVVRLYLAGHSREEIAELLGWSEAKTRNLLYRGLADLRERLAAEESPREGAR